MVFAAARGGDPNPPRRRWRFPSLPTCHRQWYGASWRAPIRSIWRWWRGGAARLVEFAFAPESQVAALLLVAAFFQPTVTASCLHDRAGAGACCRQLRQIAITLLCAAGVTDCRVLWWANHVQRRLCSGPIVQAAAIARVLSRAAPMWAPLWLARAARPVGVVYSLCRSRGAACPGSDLDQRVRSRRFRGFLRGFGTMGAHQRSHSGNLFFFPAIASHRRGPAGRAQPDPPELRPGLRVRAAGVRNCLLAPGNSQAAAGRIGFRRLGLAISIPSLGRD